MGIQKTLPLYRHIDHTGFSPNHLPYHPHPLPPSSHLISSQHPYSPSPSPKPCKLKNKTNLYQATAHPETGVHDTLRYGLVQESKHSLDGANVHALQARLEQVGPKFSLLQISIIWNILFIVFAMIGQYLYNAENQVEKSQLKFTPLFLLYPSNNFPFLNQHPPSRLGKRLLKRTNSGRQLNSR